MTSLNLPQESMQPPALRARAQRRTSWLLALLAALMIIAAVQVCSWAASSGLVLPYIGEDGLSRLDADYSPWEFGAPLPLDIPRLATAASRGEDDWSAGNLPAPTSTPTPTPVPVVGVVSASDTPTGTATGTPTEPPTDTPLPRTGGGGTNPTPVPPTAGPTSTTGATPTPGTGPTPTPGTGPTSPPPTSPPPTSPPPTSPPPTSPPPTDPPPTDPPTPTPCSGWGC